MPSIDSYGLIAANTGSAGWSRKAVLTVSQSLALCSFVVGQCALLGYRFSIADIIAPLGNKAIHPASAIGGMLLACCVLLAVRRDAITALLINAVSASVMIVAGLQLLFPRTTTDVLNSLFPFIDSMQFESPPAVATHTALCLFLLACAVRLRRAWNAMASQVFAFLAYGLPAFSLVGYLLGIEQLQGQMSLTTTLVLIPLCAAAGTITVDRGFLRALLGPRRVSAISRRYLTLIMLLPYLIGLGLINIMPDSASTPLILLIVATSQFVGLCVCFLALSCANVERQSDVRRRMLESQAHRDHLTGALSRSWFTQRAGRVIAQRKAHDPTLTVLFIDVDNFKRINDRYGHATGDHVLQRIIALTRGCLRHEDMVARWGGEEFVVLLPTTNVNGALEIAEVIRQTIQFEVFEELRHNPHVTVSIGCAELHRDEGFDEFIARADGALYAAKSSGRNQTVIA